MKSLLALAAVCYSCISFAQTSTLPDSCNTVMWGVVNAKGDTSYLLGTFHEFGNVFFDSYLPIAYRYKKANHIAVETVPDHLFKRPKITKNWVKDYLIKTHSEMNLKFVKNLPPSFLCYTIEQQLLTSECHIKEQDDVVSMDGYVMNGAITDKKKLTGLEDATGSRLNLINAMAGAKDNEDTAAVVRLLDMIKNEQKYIDTIRTQCWEADNYRNLTLNYHFSRQSVEDDTNFPWFLDERNDAWMPKIKEMVDTGNAFIAVGLKHLYYQRGLIRQLINSGYTVMPVKMHKTAKPVYKNAPARNR